jgi:hypothetical protein
MMQLVRGVGVSFHQRRARRLARTAPGSGGDPAGIARARRQAGGPSKQRRITRWEHEAVIEAMQRRLDEMPDAMRARRSIVEHVLGTIKDWMGRNHFRTRRLANVRPEMSLHVPA